MYLKTLLTLLLFSFIECNSQRNTMPAKKYTNDLIKETSPYLLQHAHNPVNWKAWNHETLELAKKENKLLLISAGYAACHWCHVMEHESFENDTVAKLMNDNFICIKVDREERPDIDQIYMDAVQLLTGRGGWPLNAVALPDGRPFWGGTYFPKNNWIGALTEIANLWQTDPEKVITYAQRLTEGVRNKDQIVLNTNKKVFKPSDFNSIISNWHTFFDTDLGGYNRAPKFPIPNNYHFLLRQAVQSKDKPLMDFVNTTLTKMAYGGIYDHIGGGFARYSTDTKWHIPHFEKMLYDNAQLVSLYADAYLVTKNELYKKTVYQTLAFVARELTDDTGAFYSSLDADSDNENGVSEEGAFYVWKEHELKEILNTDFDLFKDYYNINKFGYWENDNYVLIRNKSDEEIAKKNKISPNELIAEREKWQSLLLDEREKKIRPGLDDKTLTSWNALMLRAYIDAYRVFDDSVFLEVAQKNVRFLLVNMLRQDGGLNRNYKNKQSNINAYLEDYAILIDALISLHEVTLEEKWLHYAKQLTDYTLDHFFDTETQLFYFTSDEDQLLITRKIEITDNVIPSSNSTMARNLFKLSHYYSNTYYKKVSKQMLNTIFDKIASYPSGYSNWLQLLSDYAGNFYEVAISGSDALEKLKDFNKVYIPNKLVVGSVIKNNLPLLKNRYIKNSTQFYICVDNACQMPTERVEEALKQIQVVYEP